MHPMTRLRARAYYAEVRERASRRTQKSCTAPLLSGDSVIVPTSLRLPAALQRRQCPRFTLGCPKTGRKPAEIRALAFALHRLAAALVTRPRHCSAPWRDSVASHARHPMMRVYKGLTRNVVITGRTSLVCRRWQERRI